MYREGTKNYYYASADETVWKQLANLMTRINEIIDEISEKECSIELGAGKENFKWVK